MKKKKPKTHEIRTLEDILKCVDDENIDRFLEDFKMSILAQKKVMTIFDSLVASGVITKGNIKYEGFDWTDNGKRKIRTELKL